MKKILSIITITTSIFANCNSYEKGSSNYEFYGCGYTTELAKSLIKYYNIQNRTSKEQAEIILKHKKVYGNYLPPKILNISHLRNKNNEVNILKKDNEKKVSYDEYRQIYTESQNKFKNDIETNNKKILEQNKLKESDIENKSEKKNNNSISNEKKDNQISNEIKNNNNFNLKDTKSLKYNSKQNKVPFVSDIKAKELLGNNFNEYKFFYSNDKNEFMNICKNEKNDINSCNCKYDLFNTKLNENERRYIPLLLNANMNNITNEKKVKLDSEDFYLRAKYLDIMNSVKCR